MFPYWLLFTVCAFGASQFRPSPAARLQGGPLFVLAGIIIALMIGLRFEVGGDWINYESIFQFFNYSDLAFALTAPDPGFNLLNLVVNELGIGSWGVNFVCGAIFTWGLVRFAQRQPNPWLVLVVAVPYLIIVVAMGYTRQAVAIGFILLGLTTLQSGSLIRFGMCIALAATFHKTSVIILPLVAMSVARQRIHFAALMAVLAAMLYYMFLNSAMDRLVTVYVEAEYESEGAGIRVAMNLVPAALFILYSKRFGFEESERKLWLFFSYASFGALALLYFLASSTVVDRLALYLIPLQLAVLSRLPFAFPDKGRANRQLVLFVVAYSALIQFVWLNYATHASYWIPYQLYPSGGGVVRIGTP